MDMFAEILSGMAGILLLILLFNGIAILGGIALYVLQSLGLYQIAQRRGIKYTWMSWVPVLNTWILGSLSDQYNYVVHRKFRCARKWLLGLDRILHSLYQKNKRINNENLLYLLETGGLPLFVSCVPGGRP